MGTIARRSTTTYESDLGHSATEFNGTVVFDIADGYYDRGGLSELIDFLIFIRNDMREASK